jgi:hypothetical protein
MQIYNSITIIQKIYTIKKRIIPII